MTVIIAVILLTFLASDITAFGHVNVSQNRALVSPEDLSVNFLTENALKLSFGLMQSGKSKLKPFKEIDDLVRPMLYQVQITEEGKKTKKDIPLIDCSSDETYRDLEEKSTLLCADFEENEGESEPEIGVVKGIPGHADSSYLVFSLVTASSATLDREFFEEHRVVAFAS